MSTPPQRRCRRAPRQLAPGALRPSDMLGSFFVPGLAFLLAAAGVAIYGALGTWPQAHWLALHLAFVGGVSQLVLGAGQFFAGAFLATDPPGRATIRAQLVLWNLGAALIAAGVPTGSNALTGAGATLLGGGLALFLLALRGLRRRSLQHAPWAVRWYQACAVFLGVGALIGVAMAARATWTHGSLLGAHMTLNLAGWFGTAIVGTLHTFFPSLTQTRLRHPRLQRPTFAAWTSGTAMLAAGYAFAAGPLVVAGWALLSTAAAMLSLNMAQSLRTSTAVPSLPARLLAPAQLCLLAALLIALVHAFGADATAPPYGGERAAIAILLVPGWLGMTVAGSLLHLLAVLGRVRDLRRPLPGPRPARDRALAGLAALAVAALAAAR
ncbi:MAG TPA: hypothetical protein VFT42_04790, partial [Solirubrobacteraceae bacterium]|nr:hypothetical protein [Solirubrobacteraceae bacterium]